MKDKCKFNANEMFNKISKLQLYSKDKIYRSLKIVTLDKEGNTIDINKLISIKVTLI
jgi:hypothetical protein